jgi:hypothetical protein
MEVDHELLPMPGNPGDCLQPMTAVDRSPAADRYPALLLDWLTPLSGQKL